jgi:hypothetical protein
MVARVTLAEVDLVRMGLEDAADLYRNSILPALHEQDGYLGGYALITPEGKALAMTFWATEDDAAAGVESGMYAENVEKFVTIFRSPPGRETYQVVVAEPPLVAVG